MAQWIKPPNNHYINIVNILDIFVVDLGPGGEIRALIAGITEPIVLKTGFASMAAAQTALDNFITNQLGGSV